MVNSKADPSPQGVQRALLAWYDAHARTLPWRTPPGDKSRPDPYLVWLSEVMLQQTTVTAVIPYFTRFLSVFPTVQALASAPSEAVMREWAGLGYYSRARNLHAAAKAVAAAGGRFPEGQAELRALPGVGTYTAAAVAAIAFDAPAVVVDGNVERVVSRLFAVDAPLPAAKPRLKSLAAVLTPPIRAGDFAQAMMDLGATVCVPRSPRCAACPISAQCVGRASGAPEAFPVKAPRAKPPERRGAAFWLCNANAVWLVRRPAKGLLGAMAGLPTTPWTQAGPTGPEIAASAPIDADWRVVGAVRHVFTHFALTLEVRTGLGAHPAGEGWWVPLSGIRAAGLPRVFLKAAELALAHQP